MIVLKIEIEASREIEVFQRTETFPEIETHRITGVRQGIEAEASHAGEVSRKGEVEIIITRETSHLIPEDFKTEVEVHLGTNIQQ